MIGKSGTVLGLVVPGGLLAAGELLHSLGEIQIQHVDADRALARIVCLAAQAFHQRLIKDPVSPGLIFQRILPASRGGKDHGAVSALASSFTRR